MCVEEPAAAGPYVQGMGQAFRESCDSPFDGSSYKPAAACCSNPVSVLHVLYEADTVLYTKPRHEGRGWEDRILAHKGCQRYQDLSLFVPRNREANGRRSQTLWAATQGDPWRQLSQLQ